MILGIIILISNQQTVVTSPNSFCLKFSELITWENISIKFRRFESD